MRHRYKEWLEGFTPIKVADPEQDPGLSQEDNKQDGLCMQWATHMMVRAAAYDPE